MQYIPTGFWPRLITRLLDDEKLCTIFSKIFLVTLLSASKSPIEKDITEETIIEKKSTSLAEAFNLSEFNQALNNISCSKKLNLDGVLEGETLFINSPTSSKLSNRCCEKEHILENRLLNETNENKNTTNGGMEWLLWHTGIEV